MSSNPNAIDLLKENIDKIHWGVLSSNPNPNAIDLLEKNIDKIHCGALSSNPNALHLIEKRLDVLDENNWFYLSSNPGLFELDYLAMSKQRTKIIESQLIAKALHPSIISKWLDYHLENGKDIYDFVY